MFLLQNDLHINAVFLLVELVEQILIGCVSYILYSV